MGLRDLELHKKVRGTRKWEQVELPGGLAPVELDSIPAHTVGPASPPPGRPGHEARGTHPGQRAQEDGVNICQSRKEAWEECSKLVVEDLTSRTLISQ